ncbi:MAG: asparagine synthase (glutamine-hydrolyzing), partial [Proteobacteria bacterium]|nr:asparagine synthase (glutamine-hydrolyzing) [Pseudomonadota bacterium]
MCGIAGFIDFSSHAPDNARIRIKKMTAALAHRGPDDENFYVDEFAALGHRRLSIIDLSSGRQPMADAQDRFQIIFNGEIYNYREIREILIQKGYVFRTKSDTEVILNAYAEWGEACLSKLNGMFAFAIWEKQTRQLFVARDRVGKKPMYYHWDKNRFSFASEIKALLAAGFSDKTIDPRALDSYFSFGYIPAPFSIFTDIKKLLPSHCLNITQNGIIKKRYWQLAFDPVEACSLEEATEEVTLLLRKAVQCRLASEVPLGAFLSSGIDSSLVVSFMAELMDKPVITNTIGFGNPDFSELPKARKIAAHLRTDHYEFTVLPDDWESICKLAHFFDEPFADSSALPSWHVCENARKNVTVALSGDGGDEAFAGYTFRYLPHQMESVIRSRIPQGVRNSIFSRLGKMYPGSSRIPKYFRFKTILENLSVSDARAFYNDLIWLRQDTRDQLYSKTF